MSTYLQRQLATKPTQFESASAIQVQNNAGGYVYALDPWAQFHRFLILGSEGGTYYVAERPMTIENLGVARQCLALDGSRFVALIVEISEAGRAPQE